MILHLSVDIVLRNVFGMPLAGTLEIVAELYMPFVVFAALASVHMRGEEIRVDLFANLLPERLTHWIDGMAQLAMAGCAGAMAWLTAMHAVRAYRIGERIEAGAMVVAVWPGKAMVSVGFLLLVLAALARLFGRVDHGRD